MTGQPAVTLETVAFDWGDAYLLSFTRDRWVALRRDRHRFLTAPTLTGLEKAIEADYRDHPVPRHSGPPGAAEYLNNPARSDHAADAGTPAGPSRPRHRYPAAPRARPGPPPGSCPTPSRSPAIAAATPSPATHHHRQHAAKPAAPAPIPSPITPAGQPHKAPGPLFVSHLTGHTGSSPRANVASARGRGRRDPPGG